MIHTQIVLTKAALALAIKISGPPIINPGYVSADHIKYNYHKLL